MKYVSKVSRSISNNIINVKQLLIASKSCELRPIQKVASINIKFDEIRPKLQSEKLKTVLEFEKQTNRDIETWRPGRTNDRNIKPAKLSTK